MPFFSLTKVKSFQTFIKFDLQKKKKEKKNRVNKGEVHSQYYTSKTTLMSYCQADLALTLILNKDRKDKTACVKFFQLLWI